jgi:hypothetical protein
MVVFRPHLRLKLLAQVKTNGLLTISWREALLLYCAYRKRCLVVTNLFLKESSTNYWIQKWRLRVRVKLLLNSSYKQTRYEGSEREKWLVRRVGHKGKSDGREIGQGDSCNWGNQTGHVRPIPLTIATDIVTGKQILTNCLESKKGNFFFINVYLYSLVFALKNVASMLFN